MAAVLACGPGAVLSHGSAGRALELGASRGPIEVTPTFWRSPRSGIRLHQTARARGRRDDSREAGFLSRTVERTLLDLAPRLDSRQLERAVVTADRTGSLRWPELLRLLDRTPRAPWGRSAAAAGGAGCRPAARWSRDRRWRSTSSSLCREADLPTARRSMCSSEGHLVDFLWPAQQVIVETDGYALSQRSPDLRARPSRHESTWKPRAIGPPRHLPHARPRLGPVHPPRFAAPSCAAASRHPPPTRIKFIQLFHARTRMRRDGEGRVRGADASAPRRRRGPEAATPRPGR